MTVLRADEFNAFIKSKAGKMNGLLLFGSDAEAVGLLSRQLQRELVIPGQGSTLYLDRALLKEAPGRLMDEFQSLSLLGDRQVIIVEDVDDNALKILGPVIAANTLANFVLMLGGSLGKSSKLRLACEASKLIASLAVYEEDQSVLEARVRKEIATHNLRWLRDAEELFYNRVGSDRAIIGQELQKLILYCAGQSEIAESDVSAICGDTASFESDDLIDAVLAGDMIGADRMMLGYDGDVRVILIMFLGHLTRLQNLRAEIENGNALEVVIRSARPPVFYKRQNLVKAQLRSFDLLALITLQDNVNAAILQTRKLPDLAGSITNRLLISIAHGARAKLN